MGFSISSAIVFTILLCFTSTSAFTIPDTSPGNDISVDDHEFKYQNNWVHFNTSHTLRGTYTITNMSISPGQDPDEIYDVGTVVDITSNSLMFLIGRHGTQDVADEWNNWLPISSNTFLHTAGLLNFAFL